MTRPEGPGTEDPIVREVRGVVDDLGLAARSRGLDRQPEFPHREYRELGRRNLLGLGVARELGGRGLDLPTVGRALFEFGRGSGTTFAKLSMQPQFCSVLAERGSAELVDRYYRPILRGELLVGNQVTEPEAGSDVGAIRTSAHREGDHYLIEGTKSEAAFAVDADVAIVYARTGPADSGPGGVSAFLVPQTLDGVTRSHVPDMGERWMRRGQVSYAGVRLPVDHRIGPEGGAFAALKTELTRERALLAAVYLGVARASWEETVDHVGVRIAFGRPLAAQQAIAFPLTEDWARLDAAWGYTQRALSLLDQGVDASAEAALAKWLATRTALETIDRAIQFHGGAGYSQSLPHEQRYRDVRSGGLAHGTNEVMHLVAARRLWSKGT